MSRSDEELIQHAREVQQKAYAPYSKFKVGAALLTTNGRIFTGCNVENSSFGATSCAERNAVYTAVCAGDKTFQKIVIVTDADEATLPCGICRQVLFEFSPDLKIITVDKKNRVKRTTLTALFPEGFRLNHVETSRST